MKEVAQRFPLAQLMIYGLVGVVSLSCELSAFYLLREWGLPLTVTNVAARCVGGASAFTGNRAFTFARRKEARGKVEHEALRYLMLFVGLTTASTVLLHLFARLFEVEPASLLETTTKLGVEVVVVSVGFLVQKFWVFRERR